MQTKKWWTSKTIWVNISLTIVGVSSLLQAQGFIDLKTVGAFTSAAGIINLILRIWMSDTVIEKSVI